MIQFSSDHEMILNISRIFCRGIHLVEFYESQNIDCYSDCFDLYGKKYDYTERDVQIALNKIKELVND